MSLPEIILLRNRQRLRAKAVEAVTKAKLVEEITEAVQLLNLEIQEEKERLADLIRQMKEIASTLDEADATDSTTHLQRALRDAAQALGAKNLRLHNELGTILLKTQSSDGADRKSAPSIPDRSAPAPQPKSAGHPPAKSPVKMPEAAVPAVGSGA